ncbi:MAG: putative pre-16S rRNA nuclease [Chlamydiae bacterium]|nr:putative pre-16S rRNA nuclease [Chlamydiota bacterium]
MGRIVGIDWGRARIGVAVSDESKFLASPLKTLNTTPKFLDTIKLLAEEIESVEKLEAVVIGLPLKMSGEESPMSVEVRAVKAELEKTLSAPIILWDERLTTAGVERTLRDAGIKRKKRAQIVDTLAACTILQSYLDSRP